MNKKPTTATTTQKVVKMNEWEKQALTEKLIALNRKLALSGNKPIKTESEIVHKILELTLSKASVKDDGTFYIAE